MVLASAQKGDIHPTSKLGVYIATLLAEGHAPKRVSKLCKCSLSLVWKHARFAVDKGLIERIGRYPAQFRKKQKIYTPPHVVGDIHPIQPPIDIPCKFGASFTQVGKPPLIYGENGKAKDEQATHIAIFGKYKTVIWLRAGFRGETPDEIIRNGTETLKAIAQGYEREYRIALSYGSTYLDIEWIMVNLAAGKRISTYEGIKKNQRKLIAGAWHKQGDSSHPRHRQYQAAEGELKTTPTEHATIDHYLYSGQFAQDMAGLKDLTEEMSKKYSENIEKHLQVLEDMGKTLKAIRDELKKK